LASRFARSSSARVVCSVVLSRMSDFVLVFARVGL
jgi:hypothetical protein